MLIDTFHSLCTNMWTPLNKDKAKGPTTSLGHRNNSNANSPNICKVSRNVVNSFTSYSEKNNYQQFTAENCRQT